MPVREKLDDLLVRFLSATASVENDDGHERIAHLLIFFVVIGISREEIFRFLVNFLLVFIQTYERVRCVCVHEKRRCTPYVCFSRTCIERHEIHDRWDQWNILVW